MTHQAHPTTIDGVIELLSEYGFGGMAHAMQLLINECMKIERQGFLGVGPYQRSESRNGRANGFKPKRVKTRVGELELRVPQVRDADEGFYPSTLEKGTRSRPASGYPGRFAWRSRKCTCKVSRRPKCRRSPKNFAAANLPPAKSVVWRRSLTKNSTSGATGRWARSSI